MTTRAAAEAQRGYESRLRDEVLQLFRDQFDADQLARPSAADRAAGTALISDAIRDFQRRLSESGTEELADPEDLAQRLFDEVMGMGPLQQLLDDPAVEEIMINGIRRVFVIRNGRKEFRDDITFASNNQLLSIVGRALEAAGRYVNARQPIVDATLPDGSRINVVIPPLVDSPTITIRKFILRNRSLAELVRDGMLSAEAADYLAIATRAGLNMILFGATGTGKTTFVTALVDAINNLEERVITIEETRELNIADMLPDAIPLQARMRGIDDDGRGVVDVRDLTRTTLRMRPSRIIVGESRGAEALDMLIAMTSGHEGSMTTLHADSPHGALQKLKLYVLMAGEELPHDAINELIAEAIHLVIHLRQDRKSKHRYVNSIFEVTGLEHHARGSTFLGQEIFAHRGGDLVWTGIVSEWRVKLLDGIDPEEDSDDLAAGPRRWL